MSETVYVSEIEKKAGLFLTLPLVFINIIEDEPTF
jgi:hypothetical protein